MRSDGIVVTPPLLDHNLRFRARSKPFKAQAFISELAVELSSAPFCQGMPASLSAMSMPFRAATSGWPAIRTLGRCSNANNEVHHEG